eukprot:m.28127 g.28127  ORF g.28127 m.28127 type:complete len:237 (+) comp11810_c0_seq4:269-979(+)
MQTQPSAASCDAVASVVMSRLSRHDHAIFDSAQCFADVTYQTIAINVNCLTQGQVASHDMPPSHATCDYIVSFIAVCHPVIVQGILGFAKLESTTPTSFIFWGTAWRWWCCSPDLTLACNAGCHERGLFRVSASGERVERLLALSLSELHTIVQQWLNEASHTFTVHDFVGAIKALLKSDAAVAAKNTAIPPGIALVLKDLHAPSDGEQGVTDEVIESTMLLLALMEPNCKASCWQ